jgi:hypothetical protein
MSLGDHAKLIFSIAVDGAAEGERMWVIVRERTETGYVGMLDNDAFEANGDKRLLAGAELRFELRHVIGIEPGNEKTIAMARAPVPTPWQD